MQITMLNGEKSPSFNSEFSTTIALNYPQFGLTKYTMGVDDVSETISEEMKELYRREFGCESNLMYMFYYVYRRNNQWYLVAYNAQNDTSVEVDVELTRAEIDKLRSYTVKKIYTKRKF